MPSTPRILAFSGSLREGSYNMKLVRIAAAGARDAGGEVTELDIRDLPLPVYSGDLENAEGLPENARKIKALFNSHDGCLIGSPENNSMYSAALKNLIDWASRPEPGEPPLVCFKGKVAGIMSASPGALGGIRGLPYLRHLLAHLGTMVITEQKAVSKAGEAFDERGQLRDEKQQEAIRKIGERVVEVTRRLKD